MRLPILVCCDGDRPHRELCFDQTWRTGVALIKTVIDGKGADDGAAEAEGRVLGRFFEIPGHQRVQAAQVR